MEVKVMIAQYAVVSSHAIIDATLYKDYLRHGDDYCFLGKPPRPGLSMQLLACSAEWFTIGAEVFLSRNSWVFSTKHALQKFVSRMNVKPSVTVNWELRMR
ncbi:hypothetical protein ONS96_004933 [Cadophora gregata f. sp. sojae]|nr:hypothetical protein ONS96_004933 [Cadophora gregata f. sp. sojae]